MLDFCLWPFARKLNVRPVAERSRYHFFEFVTGKEMLFTEVQFYLVFGVANIFRDKSKLSQTLNII